MHGTEEEFVPEEEAEGPAALKTLREKLKKAVAEKQEYLEGWQRSRADFINLKKEEEWRRGEVEARVKRQLAEAVIPALDSFEMAFRSQTWSGAGAEWKSGIERVYQELKKSLERFGVASFSPLGEPFDPKMHEAVREVEVGEQSKDHTIASVHAAGYTLGDTLIRPAQVSVAVVKK